MPRLPYGDTESRALNIIERVSFILLCVVFVAFLVLVPFMAKSKAALQEEAWKTRGCQMYDEKKIIDVPAKCQREFIDHYKAQNTRVQPNE